MDVCFHILEASKGFMPQKCQQFHHVHLPGTVFSSPESTIKITCTKKMNTQSMCCGCNNYYSRNSTNAIYVDVTADMCFHYKNSQLQTKCLYRRDLTLDTSILYQCLSRTNFHHLHQQVFGLYLLLLA